MKFHYKEKSYPAIWKTQMKKDMWYSMEPAKLKITLPFEIYQEINKLFIDNQKSQSHQNKNLFGEIEVDQKRFNFKISKSYDEKIIWGIISKEGQSGIWDIEAWLNSSTISSKFKNNTVTAIFDIAVISHQENDKSISRELILDELFN